MTVKVTLEWDASGHIRKVRVMARGNGTGGVT